MKHAFITRVNLLYFKQKNFFSIKTYTFGNIICRIECYLTLNTLDSLYRIDLLLQNTLPVKFSNKIYNNIYLAIIKYFQTLQNYFKN